MDQSPPCGNMNGQPWRVRDQNKRTKVIIVNAKNFFSPPGVTLGARAGMTGHFWKSYTKLLREVRLNLGQCYCFIINKL